jgi:hypothetical protein
VHARCASGGVQFDAPYQRGQRAAQVRQVNVLVGKRRGGKFEHRYHVLGAQAAQPLL